jgi:8-oxo-dGTP pyrophosphatase MutT (NUDIX family)
MLDTEIIVIKEFRSPCRNEEAFVYELPGGSSFKQNSDVFQTAANELFEECGIRVDKSRLVKQGSRQAAATVATHHVHLFSCEM